MPVPRLYVEAWLCRPPSSCPCFGLLGNHQHHTGRAWVKRLVLVRYDAADAIAPCGILQEAQISKLSPSHHASHDRGADAEICPCCPRRVTWRPCWSPHRAKCRSRERQETESAGNAERWGEHESGGEVPSCSDGKTAREGGALAGNRTNQPLNLPLREATAWALADVFLACDLSVSSGSEDLSSSSPSLRPNSIWNSHSQTELS
jgi:hypothetical protein